MTELRYSPRYLMEVIHLTQRNYANHSEVAANIVRCYNPVRLHSTLGLSLF